MLAAQGHEGCRSNKHDTRSRHTRSGTTECTLIEVWWLRSRATLTQHRQIARATTPRLRRSSRRTPSSSSASPEKDLGSETSGSAAALYATRAMANRPLQAHPHCQRPGQPRMCGARRTPCFTFSEADKSLTVDLTKAKQKANVMYKVL